MLRIQLILLLIIVVGACIGDAIHVVVCCVGAREATSDAVRSEEEISMAARRVSIVHQELHDDVNPGAKLAVGDVRCCPMIPFSIPVHSCVGCRAVYACVSCVAGLSHLFNMVLARVSHSRTPLVFG